MLATTIYIHPPAFKNHIHQYEFLVAQALSDFKISTILVKGVKGCGLHGYSLVSIFFLTGHSCLFSFLLVSSVSLLVLLLLIVEQ